MVLGSPSSPLSVGQLSNEDSRLPVAKVRPNTAGPTTLSRQNHDLQNQAIKSMFSHPQMYLPTQPNNEQEPPVQVVKVREAWAALPEEPAVVAAEPPTAEVARRAPRRRSSGRKLSSGAENPPMSANEMNDAINNNGNEEEKQEGQEVG